MSKSLNFCMQRALDKSVSNYYDRDFTNIHEIMWLDRLKMLESVKVNINTYKYDVTLQDSLNNDLNLHITLIFNENAEFDYFVSKSIITDGTLLFVHDAIQECYNRIVYGLSYNESIGQPQNNDNVKYTIGNIIINTEYGNFGTKEKPWLHERVTVMIPVKYEREH